MSALQQLNFSVMPLSPPKLAMLLDANLNYPRIWRIFSPQILTFSGTNSVLGQTISFNTADGRISMRPFCKHRLFPFRLRPVWLTKISSISSNTYIADTWAGQNSFIIYMLWRPEGLSMESDSLHWQTVLPIFVRGLSLRKTPELWHYMRIW